MRELLLVFLVLLTLLLPNAAQAGGSDFQIFVQVTPTQTITLDVDAIDTIETIKAKLQDAIGIAPDQQLLQFSGLGLEDGQTLFNYSIGKESTLKLLSGSVASFASPANLTTLNLNIGTFDQNSGSHLSAFNIFNIAEANGFSANLSLVAISLIGDNLNLNSDLVTFKDIDPGGNILFSAGLDTLNLGSFDEQYELQLRSTGFTDRIQFLTINLTGSVREASTVPEPGSLALLGLGLVGLAHSRKRKVQSTGT